MVIIPEGPTVKISLHMVQAGISKPEKYTEVIIFLPKRCGHSAPLEAMTRRQEVHKDGDPEIQGATWKE